MGKRIKEHALSKNLPPHEQFLINNLRQEWEEAEKAVRKEELKKRAKETVAVIAKSLLILLAIGGVITVAVVAPNIFAAFGKRKGHRRFFATDGFRYAKRTLRKQGLIQRNVAVNSLELTDRGRERALKIAFTDLKIKEPERWDGRWRIVFFDVPTKQNWGRDGFRNKLKLMGFFPFQKSVFVYPYPCDEEICFLSDVYNLEGRVHLVETDLIREDKVLKEYFNLV